MLLKKQTVWLLTMLSLVFVLSVYYFLGNQDAENMATDVPGISEQAGNEEPGNGEEGTAGTDGEEAEGTEDEGNEVVNYISGDEAFTELRLELENVRSQQRADLNEQMANTELPAEEISKARDELNALNQIAGKELMIETSIKSRKDVEDAIVRVTGEQIKVTVKVNGEHNPQMANEIYHIVRSEFTDVRNENIVFDFASIKNE
ncbi:SpoIIIAH-like family protein [Bacillus haimaensis]|uniref:SpoIIIAH-like family protein n=1 Tax=Bacillus haimaensis TaxID=3160967 RepID=UPI003AA92598